MQRMSLSLKIRKWLYRVLVECDPLIRDRYVRYKQSLCVGGIRGLLNKIFFLLRCYFRRLFLWERMGEDNTPYLGGAESSIFSGLTPKELADKLAQYDVVSFDIFDTLLFRPFAAPVDLFHIVGEELGYLNYAVLRHDMEVICRETGIKNGGSGEVTLEQIYMLMERQCGVPARRGMEAELRVEANFLYANPYMKAVFDLLRQKGKRIIVISDTYFSSGFLLTILEREGYRDIEKVYVSCEYGYGKHDGKLFGLIKQELENDLTYAHVGDNARSDIINAKRNGFETIYYPNVNLSGAAYRTKRQSRVTGSAYAGIVNAHLYNGMHIYDPFYEYGYKIGGLFVLGYCNFIRQYTLANNIDIVLFLARDGDIIKHVYDMLYPDNCSKYVLWSRTAAAILGSDYFRFDYLSRFIFHKVNRKKSIDEILVGMGISEPLREIVLKESGLSGRDILTANNCAGLEKALLDNWSVVQGCYYDNRIAAKNYFEETLRGYKRACTVDVGWVGSGGVILSHLVNEIWQLDCKLVSTLIAGTTTKHNADMDATQALLTSGKMQSYMFSMAHNREYWSVHNPLKGHMLFFEALLSSPTPGFTSFTLPKSGEGYHMQFKEEHANNTEETHNIQAGILDFAGEYVRRFAAYPYMLNISGNDVYAPFAALMEKKGKYFKELFKDYMFEPYVADKVSSVSEIVYSKK